MFDKIGKKIMALANVIMWFGIVASILTGIAMIAFNFITGLLVAVLGCIGSWVGAFALYAMGQLVDDVSIIRQNLEERRNESDN